MKILVIESHSAISSKISGLCESEGMTLVNCHDEKKTIEIIESLKPIVLVVECKFLQEMQIFINAIRSHKISNDLPILFVCDGETEKEMVLQLREAGHHDLIVMPLHLKEFLARLKILCKLSTAQNLNRASSALLDQLNIQLAKGHLKFLKIMELMPVGIIIYDENMSLEFMNHEAELLTGYQASYFMDQKFDVIYSTLQLKESFEGVLKKQGDFFYRDTLVNRHKRIINIERKCLHLEGKDKKNISKVEVFRDITTALELEILLEARIEERSLGIMATQNITMMALASLAESRDNETGMHLERMRTYSQMIAQNLLENEIFPEVDQQFVIDIYSSSPLHDIGKVGTPDYVLLKPGKLSIEEWEIMKMHPAIGAKTLEDAINQGAHASFLEMARDICLGHHERVDGSGYPKGLKGEQIPLSARIVALADCYDALRSARIYKKAFTHEESKQFILEKAGLFYDQKVVAAFIRIENKIIETAEKFRDDDKPLDDFSYIRQ
jgi:response regulator RpfG family c-di-GMP phosphodiesterase